MSIKQLSFPLNAFVQSIQLTCGEVGSASFGLFEDGTQDKLSMAQAQKNLLERISSLANGDAGNVLVCGTFLIELARQLAGRNHVDYQELNGLFDADSNDGSQPDTVQLIQCPVEKIEGEARYDLIISFDVVTYTEQLSRLIAFRRLLKPGGRLVWVGEFAIDNSRRHFEQLSLLTTFQQLVLRLGFVEITTQDLSEGVRPSIGLVAKYLDSQKQELRSSLQIQENEINQAVEKLAILDDDFSQSRHGFFLQEFVHPKDGDHFHGQVLYEDINSFHPTEVSELFKKSFGQEFDEALWSWKYGSGRGRAIVAKMDGEIVAHYGGAPRDICYFGQPSRAIQICDVMVLPEERRFYGQESLFFKVAATFLEREIGNTVEHLLGFGFPNLKAMQIAIRLKLYEKTDDFVEVFYPRQAAETATRSCTLTALEPDNRNHHQWLGKLWEILADQSLEGVIGVRDWQYVEYRYLNHPSHAYQCYFIADNKDPEFLVFVVLKKHEDSWLLLDIIGSRSNFKRAIVELNGLITQWDNLRGIKCWITNSWHHALVTETAEVNDLKIEIPCHSWTLGPSAELLYGKWWLTAGDMDFI